MSRLCFFSFTWILVILCFVVCTTCRTAIVSCGIQVVRVDVLGLEWGPDAGAEPVAGHHNRGHQSASLRWKPGLEIKIDFKARIPIFVKDQCFSWYTNFDLIYRSEMASNVSISVFFYPLMRWPEPFARLSRFTIIILVVLGHQENFLANSE